MRNSFKRMVALLLALVMLVSSSVTVYATDYSVDVGLQTEAQGEPIADEAEDDEAESDEAEQDAETEQDNEIEQEDETDEDKEEQDNETTEDEEVDEDKEAEDETEEDDLEVELPSIGGFAPILPLDDSYDIEMFWGTGETGAATVEMGTTLVITDFEQGANVLTEIRIGARPSETLPALGSHNFGNTLVPSYTPAVVTISAGAGHNGSLGRTFPVNSTTIPDIDALTFVPYTAGLERATVTISFAPTSVWGGDNLTANNLYIVFERVADSSHADYDIEMFWGTGETGAATVETGTMLLITDFEQGVNALTEIRIGARPSETLPAPGSHNFANTLVPTYNPAVATIVAGAGHNGSLGRTFPVNSVNIPDASALTFVPYTAELERATVTISFAPTSAWGGDNLTANDLTIVFERAGDGGPVDEDVTIYVNQAYRLNMPLNPPAENVVWESSNDAVAVVDQRGFVVGISVGTAVITVTDASDQDNYLEAAVTVLPMPERHLQIGWTSVSSTFTNHVDAIHSQMDYIIMQEGVPLNVFVELRSQGDLPAVQETGGGWGTNPAVASWFGNEVGAANVRDGFIDGVTISGFSRYEAEVMRITEITIAPNTVEFTAGEPYAVLMLRPRATHASWGGFVPTIPLQIKVINPDFALVPVVDVTVDPYEATIGTSAAVIELSAASPFSSLPADHLLVQWLDGNTPIPHLNIAGSEDSIATSVRMTEQGAMTPINTGTGQGWGGGLFTAWFRGVPEGSALPTGITIPPVARNAAVDHRVVNMTLNINRDSMDFNGERFVDLRIEPQPHAPAQGWPQGSGLTPSYPATPLFVRVFAVGEAPNGTEPPFDGSGGVGPTGPTVQLTATIDPSSVTFNTLAWGSSNTGVATVDQDGLVTAVNPGTANIVVRSVQNPDARATAVITVVGEAAISSINVTPAEYTIYVGEPAAPLGLAAFADVGLNSFDDFITPMPANVESHPWWTQHNINDFNPQYILEWVTDRVWMPGDWTLGHTGTLNDVGARDNVIAIRPNQTTTVTLVYRAVDVIHPNTFSMSANHNPTGAHTFFSTPNNTGAQTFWQPLFTQGYGINNFTSSVAGGLGNVASVGGSTRSDIQTFGYEFRLMTANITPTAAVNANVAEHGPQLVRLNAVFDIGRGNDVPAGPQPDWRPTGMFATNYIYILVDPEAPLLGGEPETRYSTVQLTAALTPNVPGTVVTWESSNPAIATVSDTGLVTAVSGGAVTITASAGGASGASEITVVGEVVVPPTDVEVTPDEAEVQVGSTTILEAAVYPAEANQDVVWSSSDEAIARVNEDGVVAGVSEGTVTITAASVVDEYIIGTAEVTVIPRVPDSRPGRNITHGFILQHSLDLFVGGTTDYMDAFFHSKPDNLIPGTDEFNAYIALRENGPLAQGRYLSVAWRTSDDDIVTVQNSDDIFNPARGILTAVGIREQDEARGYSYATIFASVYVNGQTFEVSTQVRVYQPNGVDIVYIDDISLLNTVPANTVRVLAISGGSLTNAQINTIVGMNNTNTDVLEPGFPNLQELYIIGTATVPHNANAAWGQLFRGIGHNPQDPINPDPSRGDLRRLVIYNTTHFGNDYFRDSISLEYLYLRHAIFKGTRVIAMPQHSQSSRMHTVRSPQLEHITFRTWYYNTVLSTLELGPQALHIERPPANAGLWFSFSSLAEVMREVWPDKPYFMTVVIPDYAAFREFTRMEPDEQNPGPFLAGQLNDQIPWVVMPFRALNGEHLPEVETHPPYVDEVYNWLQEYYRVDLPFDNREIPISLNFFTFAQHLTVANAWWRPVAEYYRYVESKGGNINNFVIPVTTPGPPDGLTILDVITWAKQVGYDGVDVTGYYLEGYQGMRLQTPEEQAHMLYQAREIRRYAELLGIEITGTGFGNSFTDANPERIAMDLERYKFFMHVANAMGAPVVRVFAGNVPADEIQLGWNYIIDNRLIPVLVELSEYITTNGFDITLGVQNHGDVIATENQALYLIHSLEALGITNIGLVQDTGFWRGYQSLQSNFYDWYHAIAATLPISANFQLKKKPAGAGTAAGWLDLDRVFRDIRLSGYQGTVPIELLWGGAGIDNDLHYSPDPRITLENLSYWEAQFGRSTAQRAANEAEWFKELTRIAERRSLDSNMDIGSIAGVSEIAITPTNRTVTSQMSGNTRRVYGRGNAADPRVRQVTVNADTLSVNDIIAAHPSATVYLYANAQFNTAVEQVSLNAGANDVFVRVVSANRYMYDFPRDANGNPTWEQAPRTGLESGLLTVRRPIIEETFYRVNVIASGEAQQTLAAPTISIDGTVVSWNAVANADGYRVYVGGVAVGEVITATTFNLATLNLGVGTHAIQVRAIGSGDFTDSELSTSVDFAVAPEELAAPDISIDGTVVSWDAVANADGYRVYVGGVAVGEVITATTFNLAALNLGVGTHTIQVRAIGSGDFTDSELSTSVAFTIQGPQLPPVTDPGVGTRPSPDPGPGIVTGGGAVTPAPAPPQVLAEEPAPPEVLAEPGTWTPNVTPQVVEPIFEDVSQATWYAEYIAAVTSAGIFAGVEPGVFDPQGSMTRAMFAQVLAALDGADLQAFDGVSATFTDVMGDAWYFAAVEWAASLGIVSGMGDGTFDPDAPITREQMAFMLFRFIQAMGIEIPMGETNEFVDQSEISPWALEAVVAIHAKGIMVGMPDGSFAPGEIATRAEAAAIFARFLEMVQ